jgi:hypothetical protein
VVVALLSNGYHDEFTATIEALLRAVVDPFPGLSGYTGPGFDPAAITEHPGIYVDPGNVGPVVVTAGGLHGLQVEIPWLTSEGYVVEPDLVPESTDRWLVTIDHSDFDLTFVRGEDGQPSWLRNHLFVGTRIAPLTVPPLLDEPPAHPEVLQAFLGPPGSADPLR